jgi:hypothetical protein
LAGDGTMGQWYSLHLRHMREPSLFSCRLTPGESVIRFLWERSFHEPIAARLTVHRSGSATLTMRVLAHGTLLPPQRPAERALTYDDWLTLSLNSESDITPGQVKHVQELFRRVDFRGGHGRSPHSTDGSDWVLEAVIDGRYFLIDQRNVDISPLRELGLYLVPTLGKLNIPSNEIY